MTDDFDQENEHEDDKQKIADFYARRDDMPALAEAMRTGGASLTEGAKRETIAALNDALRTTFQGGQVLVTTGVQQSDRMADILEAVRCYDFRRADRGNDPYGEHDFGAVTVLGEKYFFKIDYYDLQLRYHSLDPADPKVTRRVLTIMRADEY